MQSHLLSWIAFTPLIGVLAVLATPQRSVAWIRTLSLVATFVPLALASWMYIEAFRSGSVGYMFVERTDWIRAIRAEYYIGIDGLSLALVWLTTLLLFIAVLASFSVARAGKAYFALLLLLEVGIIGAFLSLDCFLFYVFWELLLLPLHFLIGIWGGARREHAATKLLAYSIAGSVLLLVAMIALRLDAGTFSIPTLVELARSGKLIGQNLPGGGELLGMTFRTWCFWFLVLGFAIKLPLVPLHTWLADAQAEAPTPIAMIMVGVVIKLGAFALLRACFPILPDSFREFAFPLGTLGVIGIVYGAVVALAQSDFKRVIACSAVSQMGFVLLGTAAMTQSGASGAALQLFNHGASAAALTLMAGVLFERVQRPELGRSFGSRKAAPRTWALGTIAVFASVGLPIIVSQVLTLLGAFESADPRFKPLAIVAGVGALSGGAAMIWTWKRMFFGPLHPESAQITDISAREIACQVPLLAVCLAVGAFPFLLLVPLGPSVKQLLELLRGAT